MTQGLTFKLGTNDAASMKAWVEDTVYVYTRFDETVGTQAPPTAEALGVSSWTVLLIGAFFYETRGIRATGLPL